MSATPRADALIAEIEEPAARDVDTTAMMLRAVRLARDIERDLAAARTDLEYVRELREKDAADYARAISEGTCRWIPVGERMPEINPTPKVGYEGLSDEVLIRGEDGCDVAAWDTTGGWYSVQRATYLNESAITHWMPLPEAPK